MVQVAGERSLSKRLQTVAQSLCQVAYVNIDYINHALMLTQRKRAETRLLLLSNCEDPSMRLTIMQKSLHDSIKVYISQNRKYN